MIRNGHIVTMEFKSLFFGKESDSEALLLTADRIDDASDEEE